MADRSTPPVAVSNESAPPAASSAPPQPSHVSVDTPPVSSVSELPPIASTSSVVPSSTTDGIVIEPSRSSPPPPPLAEQTSAKTVDGTPADSERPKSEHEVVIVPRVNALPALTSESTSPAPVTLQDPTSLGAGSAAAGSSNKLTRWLSRGSNESGSSSSTKDARKLSRRASGPNASDPNQQPTISVSPSSSAHSRLSSRSVSPVQTRRSSASCDKEPRTSSSHRVIGALSLRNARNKGKGSAPGSTTTDEVLEDWAEANYDEGSPPPMDPFVMKSRSGEALLKADKAAGGGRFSLRKTRSKLFGRNEANEERESAIPEESITTASASPGRRANKASSSSVSLGFQRKKSAPPPSSDSQPTTPTPDVSGFDPDFNPQPPSDPFSSISSSIPSNQPSVGGRIGGWFNSILNNNNSSGNLLLSNEPPSPASGSRVLPRLSSSTSGSPSVNSRTSPSKRGSATAILPNGGVGRLGPLDRFLDKTAHYFLDSDSHADKCEDEIWLLGVRHPGYQAPPRVIDDLDLEDKGIKTNSPRKRLAQKETIDAEAATSEPAQELSVSTSLTTFGWPAQFYHDFYSRIALTYRSGFPPIPCSPSNSSGFFNSLSMSIGRGANGRTAEGLSTDSGWGCMLRTGQSLLANTLMAVHLGRDWRRPLPPSTLPSPSSPSASSVAPAAPPLPPSFATYARILSLFIDDPSPLAPFSVHRFALMGKQLGKEVGEWFGPSTAMGAIKALVNDFEPAGLSVVGVNDGTIYRSEVEAAAGGSKWERPVLVLLGLRLGIEGVNPIYYEAVKGIFRFPQSVGIAGGRPSSSYYFVGAQASSLFYIDPHHPRPSIPLRQPPVDLSAPAQSAPLSPSSKPKPVSSSVLSHGGIADSFITVTTSDHRNNDPRTLSALSSFFAEAYPDSSLASYHCDRVRKMALASLDPSMLLGFLIRDQADWDDFASRVQTLSEEGKPILSIADQPPAWMRRSTGGMSSTTTIPTAAVTSDAASVSADEFSEPDDWELDSTDASGASSAMMSSSVEPIGAECEDGAVFVPEVNSTQRPCQLEVEDWVEETDRAPSPHSSGADKEFKSEDEIWSDSPSPARTSTTGEPLLASKSNLPLEEHSPMVGTVGDDAVLVPSPVAPTTSATEEGWEGVHVASRTSDVEQTPRPSSDTVFIDAREHGGSETEEEVTMEKEKEKEE